MNNLPNVNSSKATIQISNCNFSFFNITNAQLVQAIENPPCTHYRVNITTSELATQYTINNEAEITGNTSNPISFEVPRGQGYLFSCQNANGQNANGGITFFEVPRPFNSALIKVIIP